MKFLRILGSGPAAGRAATSSSSLVAAFSPAVFLLLLMPPGFTTCPTAGNEAAARPPTTVPSSRTALGDLVTSSRIEARSCWILTFLRPQDRGGSGRAGLSGPPFPCSE